jgi:fatty-acyl-CoA synthase
MRRYVQAKKDFLHQAIKVCRSYNSINYMSSGSGDGDYLSRNKANYVPLSPISTFNRTVIQSPSQVAYIKAFKIKNSNDFNSSYQVIDRTWKKVGERVSALASGLINHFKIKRGDVVSIIAPNSIAIFEAHFAIPGI